MSSRHAAHSAWSPLPQQLSAGSTAHGLHAEHRVHLPARPLQCATTYWHDGTLATGDGLHKDDRMFLLVLKSTCRSSSLLCMSFASAGLPAPLCICGGCTKGVTGMCSTVWWMQRWSAQACHCSTPSAHPFLCFQAVQPAAQRYNEPPGLGVQAGEVAHLSASVAALAAMTGADPILAPTDNPPQQTDVSCTTLHDLVSNRQCSWSWKRCDCGSPKHSWAGGVSRQLFATVL